MYGSDIPTSTHFSEYGGGVLMSDILHIVGRFHWLTISKERPLLIRL
jgi:hypothetical protein